MLRLAPFTTVGLLLAPIVAGLAGTLLPAFGIDPALGSSVPSFEAWRILGAAPGLSTSLRLTLSVGFGATLVSFLLAAGFCALSSYNPIMRCLDRVLVPLLATPHVAVAVGFAFLIAPSGWIVRLISPELTGWDRPPDLSVPRDPFGLVFLAGLVLKETPYLVLMMISAMRQSNAAQLLAVARSLGYGPATAYGKIVLPAIYRQIRLPVYAVLAFSLSVVEVALVLAPANPPPLAIVAARWFSDPDLTLHSSAAAAALLQAVIVAAGIALWRGGEIIIARICRRWIGSGKRRDAAGAALNVAGGLAAVSVAISMASLAVLAVWAFARDWQFPDGWPGSFTLATWARLGDVSGPAITTVLVAAAAALIAVGLTLACLENEQRHGIRPGANALWLLYAPLLLPQIAFLFGAQILLVRLDLDGTFAAVVWAHLVFVLPYVFLSLADPYRALDPRFARTAAALGASPSAAFWTVKAPLLLRPILVGFSIGFAVSVAQYLPTLFAGAGRVTTLTTETLTLATGADRRIVGATALLQSVLPLAVYALALAIPHLLPRGRRGPG